MNFLLLFWWPDTARLLHYGINTVIMAVRTAKFVVYLFFTIDELDAMVAFKILNFERRNGRHILLVCFFLGVLEGEFFEHGQLLC